MDNNVARLRAFLLYIRSDLLLDGEASFQGKVGYIHHLQEVPLLVVLPIVIVRFVTFLLRPKVLLHLI